MSQEIGPLTLSERQLLMDTQTKASEWTEIGEAKITTTIFGTAKICIVRKHDKIRGAMFWLALLVTAVLAWVVWETLHPAEPPQRIEFAPPITANGETNVQFSPLVVVPVSAVSPTVKAAPQLSDIQKKTEPLAVKPAFSNPLHRPPQATVAAPPRIAYPVASSQSAVAPQNKADITNPPVRETLPVDPVKEKH
jgi:hypothetical protein